MTERDPEPKPSLAQRVDCRFPHDDEPAALALVEEAVSESRDALFAVLYEVANPPYGVPEGGVGARAALVRLSRVLEGPASRALCSRVMERLEGRFQKPSTLLSLMDDIMEETRSSFALSVVACLVDVDADPTDSVERRYHLLDGELASHHGAMSRSDPLEA